MNDRFNLRYVYKNKIYDVFAVDFCEGKAQLVSLNGSEMLFTKIDTDKLFQCTGLRDKNGKLIFERDIVKIFNTKDNFEQIRLVVFKDCAFQFNLPNSMQIDKPLYCWAINYLNHYKHIDLEIIGNIYENPELLEEN